MWKKINGFSAEEYLGRGEGKQIFLKFLFFRKTKFGSVKTTISLSETTVNSTWIGRDAYITLRLNMIKNLMLTKRTIRLY